MAFKNELNSSLKDLALTSLFSLKQLNGEIALMLLNSINNTYTGTQVTTDKLESVLKDTFNSLKLIINELDLEFDNNEKMSIIGEVHLQTVLGSDKTDIETLYLDFDRSLLKLSNQLEYIYRSNDFHRNNLQNSLDDFVYYTVYLLSKSFKSQTLLKLEG